MNNNGCWSFLSTDLLCYSKLIQQKLDFFTQESRQKQPLFSSTAITVATNISQAKKAIDQSFLAIKRMVFLLKYRFFVLRDLLEKNQALIEQEAKISQNKDTLTFIKGLVLGQKDKNNDYYEVFQMAGMVHVLVASGFNVSLLAGLINDFLFFVSRRVKLSCSLLIIWFYIWFLNAEAPLLRAGVMASFYLIIKYFGSRISSRRIVFYSGVILLTFSPALLKSLSFWFSFLATIGLLLFNKPLLWFFDSSSLSLTSFLKTEFLTSLAAQLLILPLVISLFSELNWLSFVTNTLLLFPIAWFTQVGFFVFIWLTLTKNSIFVLILRPFLLIYSVIIDNFISIVAWFTQLYFLKQPLTLEEKTIYLLVWLLVFCFLLLRLHRKTNRKCHFFHEIV